MLRRLRALSVLALLAACTSAQLTQAPLDQGSHEGTDEECAPDDETCAAVDPSAPLPEAGRARMEAGAVTASAGVTIQVQPSDAAAAVLAAIRGATTSVHMTMYLLTSNAMIDALGDLKEAGKDVKVVLNKTFPPDGGDNMPAFNALTARGVEVHWAPSTYTFTHAKTILIDDEKVIIMTMNLTYSSPTTNREYIATDTDPEDVADCKALFDADFANKPLALASKLVISPSAANTKGSPRELLKGLIDSAKTSLDVEVQSLSDATLVDAIILAHQANVAVRVVIDGDTSNTTAQKAAITKFKQYGVPLKSLKNPDLHAKAIVADDRAFVGSQNFTTTALVQNREVGLITSTPSEMQKVKDQIAADFEAGAAL